MSNSIWKMPAEKPKSFSFILEHYKSYSFDNNKDINTYNVFETGGNPQNPFDGNTIRWCYLDNLIAQADKAERLEKENEAMREEFEVWHRNYKCEVEDKERLQKVVFFLTGHLRDVLQLDERGHIKLDEITKQQIKTAISDPVGIITQLEQESNN